MSAIIPNYWNFIIYFFIMYLPVAILMGRWHIKHQTETDYYELWNNNRHLNAILQNQKKIMDKEGLEYVSPESVKFED